MSHHVTDSHLHVFLLIFLNLDLLLQMIEYIGEIVRPPISDIRERRIYNSLVGAGTYMFRIDDERVIDATRAGSIAHLINHSCEVRNYVFVLQRLSVFCWKFRSPYLLYADDARLFAHMDS